MAELVLRGLDHPDAATNDLRYRRYDVIDVFPDGQEYGTKDIADMRSGKMLLIRRPGVLLRDVQYLIEPDTEDDLDLEITPATRDTPAVYEQKRVGLRARFLDLDSLEPARRAEVDDHDTPTDLSESELTLVDIARERRA